MTIESSMMMIIEYNFVNDSKRIVVYNYLEIPVFVHIYIYIYTEQLSHRTARPTE